MLYFLLFVLCIILADIFRSAVVLWSINKQFYEMHASKPRVLQHTFGKGPEFNLVILGDSTFDVRADSKTAFGPAQVLIDKLAAANKVQVHFLAVAGAKSQDVVNKQLPQLESLSKVDLIISYFGANNLVRFGSPYQVVRDYGVVLSTVKKHHTPVIASEIANYWHLSIFSWMHRAWIFCTIQIANRKLRDLFRDTDNAVLVPIKDMHTAMHGKRREIPYLSDGFHPNEYTNIKWGEKLLAYALNDPKTKALFTDILNR